MKVLFLLFAGGCVGLGIVALWFCFFHLLMAAIERTLAVSSLVEAALEAHDQGRAPIFRAWRGFGKWWHNEI